MAKADLQLKLAKRLAGKRRGELAWADLQAAVQALIPAEKAAIMADIRANKAREVGRAIIGACYARANTLANGEVSQMLDDDSLSLDELERLL